jgi:D-alanyl-D-alanine-carboxypeptidase/D-alanyl-D-alanine-endopeptidase
MRTLISVTLLLACSVIGVPVSAQSAGGNGTSFPPDSVILSILKERVEKGRIAGMVVGLLEADGATRVLAWGDPGPRTLPLDGASVFEIGSITKLFTGSVLADMVLKGEVSLDDPVQQYLPETVTVPTRNGIEITLGMLSEQNSGLPRMPDNFSPANRTNPYADYGAEDLYEFLSGHELRRNPGESFEYSNLAVGLLGHTLAIRAGQSYEELVRERILDPLGMTHTGVALTPWMGDHLALGHRQNGRLASNWGFDALAGAGAIRSTAEDMLKFIDAALHPEGGSIHKAMAFAQEERADAGGLRIGLNWLTIPAGSDKLIWHNGGTRGYRTFMGIIPARGIGVVVLTNSGGRGADDVGLHLLDPEFPLYEAPNPWRNRLLILALAVLAVLSARFVARRLRRRSTEDVSPTSRETPPPSPPPELRREAQ